MGILKVLTRLFHSQTKIVRRLEMINPIKQSSDVNFVYVLGSGYKFVGKAVLVSVAKSRFLFNCSPGTSRTLTEHRGKYRNLSAIMVTRPLWENIGGLLTVSLKLNESRSKDCAVLGFPIVDNLLEAGKIFLHFHFSKLVSMEGGYSDDNVSIVQIKLSPQCGFDLLKRGSDLNDDYFQDTVNVYAYILKSAPTKHKYVNIEKILEMGITPGRQLIDLLNGKNVTLTNGDVINADDVVSITKSSVVIAVECPAEDYLKSLEDNKHFQQSYIDSEEFNTTVIHFTPPSVMNRPRYIKWMKRYSSSTIHLIVNESNVTDALVTPRYRQHLLSKLHPGLFPALRDNGCYWINAKHHTSKSQENLKHSLIEPFKETDMSDWVQEALPDTEEPVKGSPMWLSKWKGMKDLNIYEARPGTRVPFRPFKVERIGETIFDELTYYEGFKNSLPEEIVNKIRQRFLDIGVDLSKPLQVKADYEKAYPRVVFLGTASKSDSRDRNVTGILLRISKDSSIILDCGEGTHSQIHRLFGDDAPEIFRSINAIYISHQHADHHMGYTDIVRERVKSFGNKRPTALLLFASGQMNRWLHFNKRFIPAQQQIKRVPLDGLLTNAMGELRTTAMKSMDYLYSKTGIVKMKTIRVPHCNESYAVSLEHVDGWKITYSGDTMYNPRLKEIGEGSDLLIHEATYDDAHDYLAIRNRHSTVGQAIEIGRQMNAKFTILTHVSQRYSIVPSSEMMQSNDFSFAFDLMEVPLQYCHHLPILHELYHYLSDAYVIDPESEEMLEQQESELIA